LGIDIGRYVGEVWPRMVSIAIGDTRYRNKSLGFFRFWRAWHLQNDVVHGKGSASVEASARFVRNYWFSLLNIRHSAGHDEKGKSLAVSTWSPARRNDGVQTKTKEMPNWEPPMQGWVKINVDAAFSAQSGEASIGLIIRDHAGQVLLTAWKVIQRCS